MTNTILRGDCLEHLRTLSDQSIHTCVTSPPYWGLRDYGVDGQIGLEETPEAYVKRLVAVFGEVRRALRDDGTVWLNLGDSYAANRGSQAIDGKSIDVGNNKGSTLSPGLKSKDLVGIPWRVAFALQADGWYLRSDIIWSKPNPMPESVTSRPTKAHEYIFLLSKSEQYYYDADAIAEKTLQPNGTPSQVAQHKQAALSQNKSGTLGTNQGAKTRNKRTVWTVATAPYKEAHFATFPPKLIEPCILAGTSAKGVCPSCGNPWERIVTKEKIDSSPVVGEDRKELHGHSRHRSSVPGGQSLVGTTSYTTGWCPTCTCNAGDPIPAVVLDPFGGAGTTALVANRLGRDSVVIELNPEYCRLIERRIFDDAPLFAPVAEKST